MSSPILIMGALAALMLLPACKTQPPKPAEPEPTGIEWYKAGCKVYGVVKFAGTDKVLTFQAPLSACGQGV